MQSMIEFTLESSIENVAGTINGNITEFNQSLYDSTKWFAITDISENNLYELDLEIVDKIGNRTNFKTTVKYVAPKFIFDRTQEDVDRVKYLNKQVQARKATDKEYAEWKTNLKGAFNTWDMDRLLSAISYLAGELNLNLNIPTTTTLPNGNWFTEFINCVTIIRESYVIHYDTPQVPKLPINSFRKLNDVERILFDIYMILLSRYNYYCGDNYFCGNEIGLL